jgi:hypothetical protein
VNVRAACGACGLRADWEVDLHPAQELAWRSGEAPTFGFACARCGAFLHLSLRWRVEAGRAPRADNLVTGGGVARAEPRLVLVCECPSQCGQRLGLRIEPDDPSLQGSLEEGREVVLNGYRCARCDSEGRLFLIPLLRLARAPEASEPSA